MRTAAFLPSEIQAAVMFALTVEIAFVVAFTLTKNTAHIAPAAPPPEMAIPIAVRPVLDEEMLLKKGHRVDKAKLPDMWRKEPPIKKFKELSAPSQKAEDAPAAIPSAQVAQKHEEPPPPEAETTNEPIDETATKDGKELNIEQEGSEEGVEEGKQTDPLKVNALAMYTAKLSAWFKRGFEIPPGQIPCDELKKLHATAEAVLGSDLFVTAVRITQPSGNALFDAQVTAAIQSKVGQAVPPPPPLYPDILQQVIHTDYRSSQCE
ncbi:MAG TPA: TonB C-terminal domain-containing protein [Polyangiaceae bacterium]|nr:TonB C-terminal domain-containing protein [Polyangiaceae bacterium]